jgi:hypothetical protein
VLLIAQSSTQPVVAAAGDDEPVWPVCERLLVLPSSKPMAHAGLPWQHKWTALGCELDDPDPGNWRFCRAGEVIFMLGRCPMSRLPAD